MDDAAKQIYHYLGLDKNWWEIGGWVEFEEEALSVILPKYNSKEKFQALRARYNKVYNRDLQSDIMEFMRNSQISQLQQYFVS